VRFVYLSDEAVVEIDGEDRPRRSDTAGEPTRHRAPTSSNIQHPHAISESQLVKDADRKRVPVTLVRRETLALALPRHIEHIADTTHLEDPTGGRPLRSPLTGRACSRRLGLVSEPIHYADSDGVFIAYQVLGEGERDLLIV